MKLKLSILSATIFVTFISCKNQEPSRTTAEKAIDYNLLNLSQGLSYEVLFQSGDSILAPNGKLVPSKPNLDCNVLIPEGKSNKAQLFLSFETKQYDENLGAGGGGMIANLTYEKNSWKITGKPQGINYKKVGETVNNCGGKLTPNLMIFSAEEFYTTNNTELYNITKDTSNFNNKPMTDNFGWIVEIDPKTATATRKMTAFGRYSHEDALCTEDGKEVYLSNDEAPAALFKFVATTPFDYSKGKLYAYSESKKWIELPNDYQSLLNIKNIAFSKGATTFTRHEWLTLIGNKLYITETGKDMGAYGEAVRMGAELPSYYKNDTLVDDPYGRILVLDIETDELKVELEGGEHNGYFFSNPDCITSYSKNGDDFLIINEDIIELTKNRSPEGFYVNEVYKYNLKTKELTRVLVAPKGSETTGGIFDRHGNYFLNIQHPDTNNAGIFNKSTLVLIKGIQD